MGQLVLQILVRLPADPFGSRPRHPPLMRARKGCQNHRLPTHLFHELVSRCNLRLVLRQSPPKTEEGTTGRQQTAAEGRLGASLLPINEHTLLAVPDGPSHAQLLAEAKLSNTSNHTPQIGSHGLGPVDDLLKLHMVPESLHNERQKEQAGTPSVHFDGRAGAPVPAELLELLNAGLWRSRE